VITSFFTVIKVILTSLVMGLSEKFSKATTKKIKLKKDQMPQSKSWILRKVLKIVLS